MALIIQCPACGKTLSFADAHAGTIALCPACGMAVQVPGTGNAPGPVSFPAKAALPIVEAPSNKPHEFFTEDQSPALAHIMLGTVAVAVALLVLVQLGAVGWWIASPGKTWEQAHRDELAGLISESESLQSRGDLDHALGKLRELDRLIVGQPIHDTALLADLNREQATEDDLIARLQRKPAPRAVAAPPITKPTISSDPTPAPRAPAPGGCRQIDRASTQTSRFSRAETSAGSPYGPAGARAGS